MLLLRKLFRHNNAIIYPYHTIIQGTKVYRVLGIIWRGDGYIEAYSHEKKILTFKESDVVILFPYKTNGKLRVFNHGLEEYINERDGYKQIHELNIEAQTRGNWSTAR